MPKLFRLLLLPIAGIAIANCSRQKPPTLSQNTPPAMTDNSPPPSPQPSSPSSPQPPQVTAANPGWNKNLRVDDVPYDLYLPRNYRDRVLVVLPGWNFPRTSWIENSPLVEYAEKYGYALLLPEMLTTLYESSYYPETEMKWNPVPGGEFIKKRWIPEIQKTHNLLLPGQNNTLLGLSTGGRGVALIALENPGLFVAGASLSGDFSQENTPDDRLMTAVYGSFSQFPDRWKGRDNPMARSSEWRMPLYLAHGTADDIVPEEQSRLFYEALARSLDNKIPLEYHPVAGAAHDYKFWGGQLPAVFQFFEKAIGS